MIKIEKITSLLTEFEEIKLNRSFSEEKIRAQLIKDHEEAIFEVGMLSSKIAEIILNSKVIQLYNQYKSFEEEIDENPNLMFDEFLYLDAVTKYLKVQITDDLFMKNYTQTYEHINNNDDLTTINYFKQYISYTTGLIRFNIEILKDIKENLEQVANGVLLPERKEVKKENGTDPKEKAFIDYLNHPNKDGLIEIIGRIVTGKKGKTIAAILLALKELNYIEIEDRERKKIYDSMRAIYGYIGRDSGINTFMDENTTPDNVRAQIDIYKSKLTALSK